MSSLILLNGWDAPQTSPGAHEQRDEIQGALELVMLKGLVKSQAQADELAAVVAQAKRWDHDIEAASKSLREPFREMANKIKGLSDSFRMPVIDRYTEATSRLLEWEAEKRRVQQRLEQQAREEADRKRREEEAVIRLAEEERRRKEREERERLEAIERAKQEEANAQRRAELEAKAQAEREAQAKAQAERLRQQQEEQARLAAIVPEPVSYQPEKTEGMSAATMLEFDVVGERAFAQWCWANNQDHFVRRVEFDKRAIQAWLNAQEDQVALPQAPGLKVRRVMGGAVRKAKAPKTLNVATVRVGM